MRVCVAAQPPAGLWASMRERGLLRGLEQRGGGKGGYDPESLRALRAYRGLDSLRPDFPKLV